MSGGNEFPHAETLFQGIQLLIMREQNRLSEQRLGLLEAHQCMLLKWIHLKNQYEATVLNFNICCQQMDVYGLVESYYRSQDIQKIIDAVEEERLKIVHDISELQKPLSQLDVAMANLMQEWQGQL